MHRVKVQKQKHPKPKMLTRNKKQETRNKKQETRNKKQEIRNKKQETRQEGQPLFHNLQKSWLVQILNQTTFLGIY